VPRYRSSPWPLILAAVALAGCTERASKPASEARLTQVEASCDTAGVREVVERLGHSLKKVPLSAPDSIVLRLIRETYAAIVTPGLLAAWLADPSRAPGRRVSSPWPERIEIASLEPEAPGICRVEGAVVYMTSVELARGGAAFRERVTLRVENDHGRWRISTFEGAGG
jgi:hypothetical protein